MKPPRLIHISKTGGQAISTVVLEQAKLRWGMFDEEYGCGMLCHRLLSNIQKKRHHRQARLVYGGTKSI